MPFVIILILLLNLITFIIFGYDKQLAKNRTNRISERSLFLLMVFGGIIGGILGMLVFRHKTNKNSFKLVVFGIVILQLALLYFGLDFFKRFS
ncbi:DUF1294 domain-containing protein [Flavobacterium ardleyense]|uniref:DUF1294 domain-containing protein n=1 Tax=Flavobacterium ardleyense TaxID=2038737 RepID=A0ABW5Z7T2_9FLAO